MRQATLAILLSLASAASASAQSAAATRSDTPPSPASLIEAHGGWAGFLDDGPSNHAVIGGATRWRVTPRLTVGPEVTYMRGPGTDRDVFVLGALTWDLRDRRSRTGATPYLVVAGGVMAHSSGYGRGTWSSEGGVSGGAGVRVDVTERFFIAPEVRIGWEPHTRITVAAGWRF